jgi:hypothetical protein
MKIKRYGDFRLGYIDFLSATLGVLIIISMLAIALMAVVKKENEGIKKNAQFVITAEWSDKIDCDVDLWIRDPRNALISYKHLESGVSYLERDDLGHRRDIIVLNGKEVLVNPENKEYATIRGIIPGEWIVNVHLYSCVQYDEILGTNKGFKPNTDYDLPVTIEIIKLNPNYEEVEKKTVTFKKIWEEITVLRFTLNERGTIIDKSTDFIEIRDNNNDYSATSDSPFSASPIGVPVTP